MTNNPLDQLPKEALEEMQKGVGEYARKNAIRAANELARRQIESLNLYQPTPIQEKYHASRAPEVLFQAGNQVGKSLAGFVEDARAVLGKDPHNKYPKRDGRLAILGYKEKHIGMVVYPYLFKAGAFNIIRDAETQLWRVYRPWVPQDQARASEMKPAPPLIPNRFIKKIAWKDKAKGVFSHVELTTGWEIHAFSSTAKPDQGFKLDMAHIDEDIIDESWYDELWARLTIRNGRMLWTALPHNENDALNRVAERAADQEAELERSGTKPTTDLVRATIYDNPFMTEKARKTNVERWKAKGEEVYRMRALGELITDSVRMYPNWSRQTHSVQTYRGYLGGLFDSYLDTGEIPDSWCLRLSVDPGFDTLGVLFMATPPEHDYHLIFDELYLRQCTASKFVEELDAKIRGRWYQQFIIDAHGGNLTAIESGISPRDAYESKMAEMRIKCLETGSRFLSGMDQIAYRETMLREYLAMTPSGLPRILYDEQKCTNLDREMTRFKKQKINGFVIDKGNRKVATHLVECLEYLTSGDMDYKQPPARRVVETPGQRRVRAYMNRKKARAARRQGFGGSGHTILGPQGAMT